MSASAHFLCVLVWQMARHDLLSQFHVVINSEILMPRTRCGCVHNCPYIIKFDEHQPVGRSTANIVNNNNCESVAFNLCRDSNYICLGATQQLYLLQKIWVRADCVQCHEWIGLGRTRKNEMRLDPSYETGVSECELHNNRNENENENYNQTRRGEMNETKWRKYSKLSYRLRAR